MAYAPLFFLGVVLAYSISKIGVINPFHRLILVNNFVDVLVNLLMEGFVVVFLVPALYLSSFVPGLLLSLRGANNENSKIQHLSRHLTFSSIPTSLALWMSFSLVLIWPNLPLVLHWIADPLAQGWNLYNLKSIESFPGIVLELSVLIAQTLVFMGFLLSIRSVFKILMEREGATKFGITILTGQAGFYLILFTVVNIVYFL